MKIGVMQGRLSPPVGGEIQNFPQSTWKEEFELIRSLPTMPYYAPDVSDIEWIVPKEGWNKNPLFTSMIKDYPINAICADAIVDSSFPNDDCLSTICAFAALFGHWKITVPLLDFSSVENKSKRKSFLQLADDLLKNRFPMITFSIEFEADEDVIDEVLGHNDKFMMTYDTGNFTSHFGEKIDHKKLLTKYIKRIDNIHLKDRTFDRKTVEPGEGDTNFVQIFETLAETNYNKHVTLQTARGITGKEPITISRHLDYFQKLMELTDL